MQSIHRIGLFSVLSLVVLGAHRDGAAQTTPDAWHVETLTIDVTSSADTTADHDFPLAQPVSLNCVRMVTIDALKSTLFGKGSYTMSVKLLDGGVEVATLGGAHTIATLSGDKELVWRRGSVIDGSTNAAEIDAVRVSVENEDRSTRVQGLHPGNTAILRFVVDAFAPGPGPHRRLEFPSLSGKTVSGTDTTSWKTVSLSQAVPATGLRHVVQSPMDFTWTQPKDVTIESQLLLDNGVILTLDDFTSPSTGAAPPSGEPFVGCADGSMTIDGALAQQIDGASITDWRWRAHGAGAGTATFDPPDVVVVSLLFDSTGGGPILPYGSGCAGTGGFVPDLSLTGCVAPCGMVTLEMKGGLGGAPAFLFLGSQTAAIPMWFGCTLNVAPLFGPFGPIMLSGSGAGAGAFSVGATIPITSPLGTVTTQGFVVDPGGVGGYSNTNGVQLTIE